MPHCPMPGHRRTPPSRGARLVLVMAAPAMLSAAPSPAAVVSWATDSGGAWFAAANWSSGALPQPTDDVVIDRPGADPVVVMTSPTQNTTHVASLRVADTLDLRVAYLTSNGPVQLDGTLRIGGSNGSNFAAPVINAGPAGRLVADNGFASINGATLNCVTYVGGAGTFASANFGSVWNAGTIIARDAGLGFYAPNLTRAAMGAIDALNCHINVSASTFNNVGQNLLLGDPSNLWSFSGNARIVGGTITGQPGQTVQFSQARAQDVTLAVDATVRDGDLRVIGSLRLEGARVDVGGGNPASLWMEDQQVAQHGIAGTGTVVLQSNTASIRGQSNAAGALVVEPGITIRGFGQLDPNNQRFINRGTIVGDSPFGTLSVYGDWPRGMRNEGTIQVEGNGYLSLTMNAGFQQAGALRVLGGTMIVTGFANQAQLGDAQNRGGEFIVRLGTTHAGQTFALDDTTGPWTLDNSTMSGGRLTAAGDARFFLAGAHSPQANNHEFRDGVVIDAPVVVRGGAALKIDAGVALNADVSLFGFHRGSAVAPRVSFSGTQSTTGTGRIVFDDGAAGIVEGGLNGATLTISPGFSILTRGGDGVLRGVVRNLGTVAATGPGRRLTVEGTLQNGGELRVDAGGTLRVTGSVTDPAPIEIAGRLEGIGTLSAVENFSVVSPGVASGAVGAARSGVLTIAGDYTQSPDALLELILNPATHSAASRLLVTGEMRVDGTLSVLRANATAFRPLDTFDLFDFASISGQFDTIALPAIPPQWHWDTSRLYVDGSVKLVPEPVGGVLLVAAAVCGRRRARRGA